MSFTRLKNEARRPRAATSTSPSGATRTSSRRAPKRKRFGKLWVTESSGNVFLDLGFPPQEAQNLLLRAALMSRIEDVIVQRKLTQARAAKLMGVSQPRISDLFRGKIDLFSIDSLIEMLGRAGYEVGITLKSKAA